VAVPDQGAEARAAERYEQRIVPAVFGPWTGDLLALVGLGPGDGVLDVACGSGAVARQVPRAEGQSRVVATDLDEAMLAAGRSAADGLRIDWIRADAGALPFADRAFDVAVCHHGLQVIPDPAGVLSEMHRVLRLGGRLGVAVWAAIERSPGIRAFVDAIDRYVDPGLAGRYRAGPFGFGPLDRLERAVVGAGFRTVSGFDRERTVRFPLAEAMVAAYAVGPAFAALPAEQWRRFAAAVAAGLEAFGGPDGVSFPMVAHAAVGIR
jgi:SAM-dependent methyltransferase